MKRNKRDKVLANLPKNKDEIRNDKGKITTDIKTVKKMRVFCACGGGWGGGMSVEKPEINFWDDWNAFYHDCSGYIGVYICQSPSLK